MRGRTNIVQRTGPTVIGNLVTRKQVTGSRIEVGNFVEFTGDTSTWETLSGPFNYQYSKSFEISKQTSGGVTTNVIFGIFYANIANSQCRLMVCDKNGIIKITNLSGISFEDVSFEIRDIYFNNNKIYVVFSGAKKVYVFDYNSSNSSMTYDTTITVTFPSYSNTHSYAVIGVRGNYIYGYSRGKNSYDSHHIVRINMDGSTLVNDYDFVSSDFVTSYTYRVLISDNYIFFLPDDNAKSRIIFNYSTSDLVIQAPSEGNVTGTIYNYNAALIKYEDYFFLVGSRSSSSNICVFYLNSSMKIVAVSNYSFNSNGGGNPFSILIEPKGDNRKITICNWGSSSSSTDDKSLMCRLVEFDVGNSLLTNIDEKVFNWGDRRSVGFGVLFLFDINDVYNVYCTKSVFSSNNYLTRTKFMINNNTIIQTESLDLVKPYENIINGVAKTGGNVGQEISVYVP